MLSLRFICNAANTHYNTSVPRGYVVRGNNGFSQCGIPGEGSCASRAFMWEGTRVLRALGLSVVMLLASTAGVSAQEWAEKMFNKTDHDFGTVARGADTVYRFEITNIYKQDMHVTGVRSSCGCTSPTVENPIVKTHEKA